MGASKCESDLIVDVESYNTVMYTINGFYVMFLIYWGK